MEESHNFGHEHPLQLLLNEEQMMILSNEISGGVADCWRCGEEILSASIFSCTVEYCGFYLHKECAEAPLEINHPFHPLHHPLLLQEIPSNYTWCHFCEKQCKGLVYHCSCGLNFHIKCALFTYNIIARKYFKDQLLLLEQYAPHQDSLISTENNAEKLEDILTQWCSVCQEPLANYAYFPLECGFYVHKRCADLPLVINEIGHHQHPLALQFNTKELSCQICQMGTSLRRGFVYCCSPCNFVVHIECVLLPPNVEFKNHQHPLVLLNEEHISNQSGVLALCWRCGDMVSAPSFSCVECGFYIHKNCADAPLQINHPFHPHHPLLLQKIPPYHTSCDFCDKTCERFIYHCSCGFNFHIKCALFTYNIAQKNFKELQHVAIEDPLISTENNDEQLEDLTTKYCFTCWEPLANYTYFSTDCGFNLHKKCADLPLQINDMGHKHPLALQFSSEQLSCKICQLETSRPGGFVYCCSPCNFVVHIECVLPPPVIEVQRHQHEFTMFRRRAPFICDACGTEGNFVSYICCTCNIIVHKKCISLPRIIKSKWHDHRIFHKYFIQEKDSTSWDCLICHDEVNVKHGSYYCSVCNIIFHVDCVTEDKDSYAIVSEENEDENCSEELSAITCVFERNDAGEATKIKHLWHRHNLMLSDKMVEYDQSCDGCMLPISDSFYCCLQCDFLLHKACAEFPKIKHVWHHGCQDPLILTSDEGFQCEICFHPSHGFLYECNECEEQTCLRCVIALTPGAQICEGHQHPILYYKEYEGQCSACGDATRGAFRCKGCNFILDRECFSLPTRARHKCDEHFLALIYHDANDYSESHYCDICEEKRDPNYWFYHCATCDTSAHIKCVIGRFPFIKLGSILENISVHPHPLTYVKKIYYYPDCIRCRKPSQDLAVECAKSGCNFIWHVRCP